MQVVAVSDLFSFFLRLRLRVWRSSTDCIHPPRLLQVLSALFCSSASEFADGRRSAVGLVGCWSSFRSRSVGSHSAPARRGALSTVAEKARWKCACAPTIARVCGSNVCRTPRESPTSPQQQQPQQRTCRLIVGGFYSSSSNDYSWPRSDEIFSLVWRRPSGV